MSIPKPRRKISEKSAKTLDVVLNKAKALEAAMPTRCKWKWNMQLSPYSKNFQLATHIVDNISSLLVTSRKCTPPRIAHILSVGGNIKSASQPAQHGFFKLSKSSSLQAPLSLFSTRTTHQTERPTKPKVRPSHSTHPRGKTEIRNRR